MLKFPDTNLVFACLAEIETMKHMAHSCCKCEDVTGFRDCLVRIHELLAICFSQTACILPEVLNG